MTKRYRVLQKKLGELELELGQAFSHPSPDSIFKIQNHRIYSEDVKQRLSFLKSLLSAEIASSPKKPLHLEHIGKRLLDLEAAFLDLGQFRSPDHHDGDCNFQEDYFDKGTTTSTCSCTESCLNDDGGSGSVDEDLPGGDGGLEMEAYNNAKETTLVRVDGVNHETVDTGDHHEMKYKEKKGGSNVRNRFCEGLVGGMVIGMGLMGLVVLRFCASYPYVKHSYSMNVDLPPT